MPTKTTCTNSLLSRGQKRVLRARVAQGAGFHAVATWVDPYFFVVTGPIEPAMSVADALVAEVEAWRPLDVCALLTAAADRVA